MKKSESTNYTDWNNSDLIQRVHDLERQLHKLNETNKIVTKQGTTSSTVAVEEQPAKGKKLKKRKIQKGEGVFDASKYNTRKIALKFAYLGSAYNGFEHHNNSVKPLPTIEEVMWKALMKTRLIIPTRRRGQRDEDISWEGCDYSKCGRTDKGVSAFGQVIGLRVRSARPGSRREKSLSTDDAATNEQTIAVEKQLDDFGSEEEEKAFDDIEDELPYVLTLNKVLPPDIRALAWCPDPSEDFDARRSCRERRYRYFFTNPSFLSGPVHNGAPGGWLDITAMQEAAKKYEGLHDFRNFCKIDGSKQISDFRRRIYHAGIHAVDGVKENVRNADGWVEPKLYYFEVRGSAFLWHQVRHLVAVLFMIGQGLEKPSVVDDLLDMIKTPTRPVYEMASDIPLVLWDCVFPDPAIANGGDHQDTTRWMEQNVNDGHEDAMNWIYVDSRKTGSKGQDLTGEDSRLGQGGVLESLWSIWRQRKLDEVLVKGLIGTVAAQQPLPESFPAHPSSARVFEGGNEIRNIGKYTPIMERMRMQSADIVNARWLARKNLGKQDDQDLSED